MKKTLFQSLVLGTLIGFSALQAEAATNVTLVLKTGSELVYSVSEAGKVYFEGDNLLISQEGTEVNANVAINTIQKVLFDESVNYTPTVEASTLSIYPTATNTEFYVSGLAAPAQVTVYNVSGVVVLSQTVENGASISLNGLEKGLYLVRINNTTFKLTKI